MEKFLGKKQAAFLARAFLMDTISTSLKIPRSSLYIAHTPPDSRTDFENFLYLFAGEEKNKKIAGKTDSIGFIPQANGDLAVSLSVASELLFSDGAKKVIFVGCDSPLLTPLVLRASFELLSEKQVVVGPTFDGGYYLLGVDDHYPALFEGIDWSSPGIYRDAVSRFSENGLKWQELELSYGVDGPDELEQLYFDIDNLRLTGENEIAYHTERCLQNLEK
ncbi:MAG: DUF2064 domain-containing protein [candidate division Zixibacteria bacterium]